MQDVLEQVAEAERERAERDRVAFDEQIVAVADAYQAFKENGIFDKATATSLRKNILERGGSEDAMTLYKRFRGREPSIEPLLIKRGLKTPES